MLEQIIKDMLSEYWQEALNLKNAINVNGNIYKVNFVDKLGNNETYGAISHGEIFVLNNLDYKRKTEVLFHEFIHALAISIEPSLNKEDWVRSTQKEFYDKIKYKYDLELA